MVMLHNNQSYLVFFQVQFLLLQSLRTNHILNHLLHLQDTTSKVKPNDNIAQSEAGDQNKLSSPTNRQVDAETAKKIEEATGQVTKSASSIVGMTITAGDANGSFRISSQ